MKKIFSGGLARDLKKLMDTGEVLSAAEDMRVYAADATHYFAFQPPEAVVLPATAREVSRVMKYATKKGVPVTPRGGGSGLSAGCTPIKGGIVLDMKRMRAIVDLNQVNMTAIVEAGMVLGDFHREVESRRLFYPPDPQSMTVCTIGGNVATRAGGPRGVKYGTTQHYVLGLEAVLPDGDIMKTGGLCVKQSVGYDLTHLLTGSEGTLAVITRATLRLLPLPSHRQTAVIVCEDVDVAASLVASILGHGVIPAKMEFMNKGGIALMNAFVIKPIPLNGDGYLLIELDGSEAAVADEAKQIESIAKAGGAMEVRVVTDDKEAESYWRARQNLNPVLSKVFKKVIGEDIAVPRDKIPDMVKEVKRISETIGVPMGLAGHAGDGNIHPNILLPVVNEEMEKKADRAVAEIVRAGLAFGGTVSGEHGVGLHKAMFALAELGPVQIEVMKRIKRALDPHNIMNPGKIWPE